MISRASRRAAAYAKRRRVKLWKIQRMEREQLVKVCHNLLIAMEMQERRFAKRLLKDLPPNIAANTRHQRAKRAWGRRKRILFDLLEACIPFVTEELAAAIKYEFDHAEFLFQKSEQGKRQRRRESKEHG